MKTTVQSIVLTTVIKNTVITGIVVASGIAGGLAVGIILGKMLSNKAYVFEGEINVGLEDDYDALMQRYEENPDANNFKPHEIANISWLKYAQEERTHSVAHCVVTAAIVKQHVYTHDVRVNNRFYSESVFHSSIKQGGFRFYQQNGQVIRYTASDVNANGTATWKEDTQFVCSLEDHETKWGKTLDRPIIYIMSDQTILEEKVEVVDGQYVIDMELHPQKANERYKRQMIGMSNLESPPSFKSLHLTLCCGLDYSLDKLLIHEAYTVYVVGRNDSDAINEVRFYHNSTEEIPDLETDYNYNF